MPPFHGIRTRLHVACDLPWQLRSNHDSRSGLRSFRRIHPRKFSQIPHTRNSTDRAQALGVAMKASENLADARTMPHDP